MAWTALLYEALPHGILKHGSQFYIQSKISRRYVLTLPLTSCVKLRSKRVNNSQLGNLSIDQISIIVDVSCLNVNIKVETPLQITSG